MRLSLILLFLQLWGNLDVCLSQNVCAGLPDVPHAFVRDESKKPQYHPGDVVYFECETGYISGPLIKYTCTNDGWEVIRRGQCNLKPCPLPEDILNGNYEIIKGDEFVFGAVIQYHCNEGYQMISKDPTRTCMLNSWTNRVPVCEPFSCDPPRAEDGLTVNGLDNNEPINPGRLLTFSCDAYGKRVNGTSTIICGNDGQWDNPVPNCEDITCKMHKLTPHLVAVELPENQTVKIDHAIQFYCEDDYTMVGSEEIKCLPSGEWDKPFPTCPEKCIVPEIPSNMRMSPEVHRGSQVNKGEKIQFQCASQQHAIKGSAEVECLDQGRWSTAFPTCASPQRCRKPPSLADGDIEGTQKNSYLHGEKVKYICQPYYILEGDPHKKCNNGQWIGAVRCLRPCTVNKDAMNAHSIMFKHRGDDKLYSTHGDHISFICSGRARHDGRLDMRQQCIDGVMNLPTCI